MALRLTLKPRERVIIGGAALRNGNGRCDLLIENDVPVLRETDILSPADVQTPCDRVYMAVQLMYVDPERRAQHLAQYLELVAQVSEAAPSCARYIAPMDRHVSAGRLYRALKAARRLIDHERELMSHVP